MTPRILIVEDNPMNMKLSKFVLRGAGYETVGAEDAFQAARVIADEMPDLIIMDIGLPGKDGYQFTSELKSQASTRQIPILVLTSYAMPSDRAKAFTAGCDGFLTKPVTGVDLLEQVHSLLNPTPTAGEAA
jgi:CheY-like chemotaxis protein